MGAPQLPQAHGPLHQHLGEQEVVWGGGLSQTVHPARPHTLASPCTPSTAACAFIAASSLRMMARHSWHRADRSLGAQSESGAPGWERPGPGAGTPPLLTSRPGTGRARGPAAPAEPSHPGLSAPELGTQQAGPCHALRRARHAPPPGAFPTVAGVGVGVDEACVKYLLSKRVDELLCYLGEDRTAPPSRRAHRAHRARPRVCAWQARPPAPCARCTHILHGQPHGLDGLHVVDLAALIELGRKHTLREREAELSRPGHRPLPEGTRPTLLDVSQYTRGTTM